MAGSMNAERLVLNAAISVCYTSATGCQETLEQNLSQAIRGIYLDADLTQGTLAEVEQLRFDLHPAKRSSVPSLRATLIFCAGLVLGAAAVKSTHVPRGAECRSSAEQNFPSPRWEPAQKLPVTPPRHNFVF